MIFSWKETVLMSTDDIGDLRARVEDHERRIKALEELLDWENHDLFEKWFKLFLDDKCNGGW